MDRTLTGWGLIYDADTGLLFSEGTVITDPLPVSYRLLERPQRMDMDVEQWDAATRSVVPRTALTRIAALQALRDSQATEILRLGGTPA